MFTKSASLSLVKFSIFIEDIVRANDDTSIAVQDNNFKGVETILESSFKTMTTYHKSMKSNPMKTQICEFHLKIG